MKKEKLIMIISLALNVIFIITIIVLLVGKNKNDSDISQPYEQDKIKQAVGVYHNSNWNRGEATIQLNNDMTCKTPSSDNRNICKWNIINDKVVFSYSSYVIKYNGDENENPIRDNGFNTLENCESYIQQRYPSYSDKLSCEYEEAKGTSEFTITNSSIVYHDHVFTRVY